MLSIGKSAYVPTSESNDDPARDPPRALTFIASSISINRKLMNVYSPSTIANRLHSAESRAMCIF